MAINMSHCRFENTLKALRECYEALDENNDPFSELSETECNAAKRLVSLCRRIADDYEEEV